MDASRQSLSVSHPLRALVQGDQETHLGPANFRMSGSQFRRCLKVLSFRDDGGVFNYRVVGVLINADAVLVQRAESDSFWALPGGRGEFGAASHDTIRREFVEEIGLEVQVQRLLWVVENFFELGEPYHEISFYYHLFPFGPIPSGPVFTGRREDRNPPLVFQWVPLQQLADLRLYPSFLPEALAHLPEHVTHIVHRDAPEGSSSNGTRGERP